LKAVQVTPVALKRVVDRRAFCPTLGTRTSCPRGEGAVEIDPARLGIEGHVNDLSGSRKAERKGKQRQRVHDENRRRLAWQRVRAYRRKEGHRVGLERTALRDGKNGATHTKRKRAFSFLPQMDANEPKSTRLRTVNSFCRLKGIRCPASSMHKAFSYTDSKEPGPKALLTSSVHPISSWDVTVTYSAASLKEGRFMNRPWRNTGKRGSVSDERSATTPA